MIINKNLQVNEPLAPKKLCTILFGTGRLKITMKRHTTCNMCQDYTRNSASVLQNLRPLAGDC